MLQDTLLNSPLGQRSAPAQKYDPGILFALERAEARAALALPAASHGADIWNAYELSWLNERGQPVVAMGRFTIGHDSPNLVESKSLKLYLASFNNERLAHADIVRQRIYTDLSRLCGAPVRVEIMSVRPAFELACAPLPGRCIDDQELEFAPGAASTLPQPMERAPFVRETLVSELLRSVCPVTGQPDWASLQISYAGPKIDPASLLRFIVGLREQPQFHEQCVESIYGQVLQSCAPEQLLVYARFTRRGGLDINPWRANYQPDKISHGRTMRQ